jgi:hypothetical protein
LKKTEKKMSKQVRLKGVTQALKRGKTTINTAGGLPGH